MVPAGHVPQPPDAAQLPLLGMHTRTFVPSIPLALTQSSSTAQSLATAQSFPQWSSPPYWTQAPALVQSEASRQALQVMPPPDEQAPLLGTQALTASPAMAWVGTQSSLGSQSELPEHEAPQYPAAP
jgi:hypothetical protein